MNKNIKKFVLTTAGLTLGMVAVGNIAPTMNTTVEAAQTGWQGKKFIKADGTYAKSEWIADNGSWFYIKDNGEYASDEWVGNYYCKYWGYMAHDEWLESNGKWYYAKADGTYAWEEWIGNYYFNYWGDMAQNEWIDYNGNWYYAKADGQYAWQEWIGNYYFNYWGDMAQNEWIDSNGKWYYAKADGSYAWEEWIGDYYFNYWGDMAKNQWVGNYYVGSDGKWQQSNDGESAYSSTRADINRLIANKPNKSSWTEQERQAYDSYIEQKSKTYPVNQTEGNVDDIVTLPWDDQQVVPLSELPLDADGDLDFLKYHEIAKGRALPRQLTMVENDLYEKVKGKIYPKAYYREVQDLPGVRYISDMTVVWELGTLEERNHIVYEDGIEFEDFDVKQMAYIFADNPKPPTPKYVFKRNNNIDKESVYSFSEFGKLPLSQVKRILAFDDIYMYQLNPGELIRGNLAHGKANFPYMIYSQDGFITLEVFTPGNYIDENYEPYDPNTINPYTDTIRTFGKLYTLYNIKTGKAKVANLSYVREEGASYDETTNTKTLVVSDYAIGASPKGVKLGNSMIPESRSYVELTGREHGAYLRLN